MTRRAYVDKTIGRSSLDIELTEVMIDTVEDAVLAKAQDLAAEYNLHPQHIFCLTCNAMLISISRGIGSINEMNGQPDWDAAAFVKKVETLMNDAFQEPKAFKQ